MPFSLFLLFFPVFPNSFASRLPSCNNGVLDDPPGAAPLRRDFREPPTFASSSRVDDRDGFTGFRTHHQVIPAPRRRRTTAPPTAPSTISFVRDSPPDDADADVGDEVDAAAAAREAVSEVGKMEKL